MQKVNEGTVNSGGVRFGFFCFFFCQKKSWLVTRNQESFGDGLGSFLGGVKGRQDSGKKTPRVEK